MALAIVAAGLLMGCFQSQPTSDEPRELPPDLVASLADVRDYAFNYDFPAVYALLAGLHASQLSPGQRVTPIVLEDWRAALDRPSDLRGRPVVLEGVVGRNSSWQFIDAEQRRRLGTIWELGLTSPSVPVEAKVLLTQDAGDVGLGSTVRVTGYFVMVQQFYNDRRQAVPCLLVAARAPTMVSRAAPVRRSDAGAMRWTWLVVAAVAALAFFLWIRWRSGRDSRTDLHTVSSHGPAPLNLADELDQWAAGGDSEQRPG
ncbi:MAG: hypothetical protein CHACPFDD_03340 [Phycisphaerae bacterium]|nr:hypothetical protein [Phycisphaerae bacterium]